MRIASILVFALLATPAFADTDNLCNTIGDNDDVHANLHMSQDFDLQADALTIAADDGTVYRATRDGDLFIDNVRQEITGSARSNIALYVERYAALEQNAEKIAHKATGLAISALTHALVALVTQGEDAVDAAVEEKTEKMTTAIKGDARNLCRIVIELRDTERKIRAEVPAFGPFIEFRLTEETAAGDTADN